MLHAGKQTIVAKRKNIMKVGSAGRVPWQRAGNRLATGWQQAGNGKKCCCTVRRILFGPAASVVCRRANIVLMTAPARQGETARTQRQANISAEGAADAQKGLCVCRGLPSVIFILRERMLSKNFFLSSGITDCLCTQSSTTFSIMQVIYFTTGKNC